VIVYCRTGMDASVPYFVLRSLGYDVSLYDGSFVEWSRDRSLPVALSSRR
jgi:thiosulfate/3-mercaptopyruvate sulfurtransferase